MNSRLRPLFFAACLALVPVVGAAGAVAAGNPSGTGQPSASCGSDNASMYPPGFLGAGFAKADLHYAGNGAPSLNANSGNAISQYDVACYQITQHH
jgi:hypothetical protein